MQGGILWRLAVDSNPISIRNSSVFLQVYKPYQFTDEEYDFIAGKTTISGRQSNRSPSIRYWLPTHAVWIKHDSFYSVGMWAGHLENWFLERVHQIYSSNSDLAMKKDVWKNTIKFSPDVKKIADEL